MEERDEDWERAHLRVEGNWGGGRHRLGESAIDMVGIVWRRKMPTGRECTRYGGNGVEERDTDWERAHLIGWEWCRGERHRLGESALDMVGMGGGGRCRLGESALESGRE